MDRNTQLVCIDPDTCAVWCLEQPWIGRCDRVPAEGAVVSGEPPWWVELPICEFRPIRLVHPAGIDFLFPENLEWLPFGVVLEARQPHERLGPPCPSQGVRPTRRGSAANERGRSRRVLEVFRSPESGLMHTAAPTTTGPGTGSAAGRWGWVSICAGRETPCRREDHATVRDSVPGHRICAKGRLQAIVGAHLAIEDHHGPALRLRKACPERGPHVVQ